MNFYRAKPIRLFPNVLFVLLVCITFGLLQGSSFINSISWASILTLFGFCLVLFQDLTYEITFNERNFVVKIRRFYFLKREVVFDYQKTYDTFSKNLITKVSVGMVLEIRRSPANVIVEGQSDIVLGSSLKEMVVFKPASFGWSPDIIQQIVNELINYNVDVRINFEPGFFEN